MWAAAIVGPGALALPAAVLTAGLAGRWWALDLALVGGGRPPLDAMEAVLWHQHDDLTAAEREHQRRADAAKSKARR